MTSENSRPQLNPVYIVLITVLSVIVFGFWTIVVGLLDLPFRFLYLRRASWGPFSTFGKVGWNRTLLWLYGIEVDVKGAASIEELRQKRGVVFVANHQSLLDIPALFKCLPCNSSFVAKKELLAVPIFGWGAFIAGIIFVNRGAGAQNHSLKNAVKYLRQGISLVFFPEGTRSKTGEMLPFKRGAFIYAIEAQCPVIPLTIRGSRKLLPKGSIRISRGTIEIIVHPPVSTVGMTIEDRHRLSDHIRGLIAEAL